ncbi:MAG TPA: hypothetical protein VLX92_20150 [Kofleriaceae bacterium]|nr:hypothetical protein [Kofleriaceae bacterium]
MPAREAEAEKAAETEIEAAPAPAEPAIEPAPPLEVVKGDLPPVTQAEATPLPATASEQAFDQKPAGGDTSFLDSGMHEPAHYKEACERAGKQDKWQDKYALGHTEASGWTQPYEGRYAMAWSLEKGHSASQAVKDFVAGPTIADYRVIGVALEMDELRDDIGDNRFDQLFGSRFDDEDSGIPASQRLQITAAMYTIPFADQMRKIADEADQAIDADDQPLPPPVEEQREEQPQSAELLDDEIVAAEDFAQDPEREAL